VAAVEDLDGLQNLFYRVLLQVPAGCPKPMLYWDVKGLLMANRILKKKLLFLHHVATGVHCPPGVQNTEEVTISWFGGRLQ
jgi:hypothetical protein